MTLLPICICADDFGLAAGINAAALELTAAGRLSAVSCMSTAPAFRADIAALREVAADRADLGLHLNLTEPVDATGWQRPLGRLIFISHLGRLPRAAVQDEIARQLDAFEDACGAAPDFVDGHQHVHQLPGVREPLLAELARRYATRLPWLRHTAPPARRGVGSDVLKQRVIAALGAARLATLARRGGFAQNRALVGVYPFSGGYQWRLDRWLAEAAAGDLLMCHPAASLAPGDPIGEARLQEYAALRSGFFAKRLAAHGLQVQRLSTVLG